MIVIDSSLWIEFFTGTKNGEIIKNNNYLKSGNFIVPTIILREVHKKLTDLHDENLANLYCSYLELGKIINLDIELSYLSSKLGKLYKLPLADSIIYATTINTNSTLYTMDKHFRELPNVIYYEKN